MLYIVVGISWFVLVIPHLIYYRWLYWQLTKLEWTMYYFTNFPIINFVGLSLFIIMWIDIFLMECISKRNFERNH